MEKDTVILNIKDYNELRDFKEYIERNYTIEVKSYKYNIAIKYISKDEAVKQITSELNDKIDAHKKETDELISKIRELEQRANTTHKEITIDDIKNMSYWEFRKWKKS